MELRTPDWEPLPRPEAAALPHSWEEIAQALNSLKIGKATRQGSVQAVLLRGLQDILLPHLAPIFDDAACRMYPAEWVFWLNKPGKTGRWPANFRDICLQEAVAKVYSQCLLWRVKEQLVSSCLPTQFGFLPGRGTQDALAIARELQCRARRCRQHLMIASFDLSQAFYKVDRALLEEILFQRLDEERAALQVCRKLDNLVYRLSQGDQILELTAPHGVTVGDTLGPLLFVVYMDAFLRDLQSTRAAQRWPLPLSGTHAWQHLQHRDLGSRTLVASLTLREEEIDFSDVVYADDHDAFRPILGWRQARLEVELIRAAHRRFHMIANVSKSSVLTHWVGKNAKKLKGLRPKGLTLSNGEVIPVVRTQTHLGAVRVPAGSSAAAVRARCAKAFAAKSRYQKKLLGNKRLPLCTRVAFYRALVLPTLLYGLETLQLTVSDTLKLESVQMGLLRAVTHAWRHKGGATNEALRALHGVPTIESALRLRRLQWWRRVLTREGPAAVIVAVKGSVKVGAHSTSPARGFLQALLTADIRALACARGHEGASMDENALDTYLCLTPKPGLGTVRVYHSHERPKQNHEGTAEKHCPDCSKCFHTDAQLAVHRRCSHGLVTERALVTSTECPACLKTFASRDGARTHFQKRLCPESRDPATIDRILNLTVPPADTAPPTQGERSGTAQAMWGLTFSILPQGSSASHHLAETRNKGSRNHGGHGAQSWRPLTQLRSWLRRWTERFANSGLSQPLRTLALRPRHLPHLGDQRPGRSHRSAKRLPLAGCSRTLPRPSPRFLLLLFHMLQSAPPLLSLPTLLASDGNTPSPGFRPVLDRLDSTPTPGESDGDRPPSLAQQEMVLYLREARRTARSAWDLKHPRKEHPLLCKLWAPTFAGTSWANLGRQPFFKGSSKTCLRQECSLTLRFSLSTLGRRRCRMLRALHRGRPPELLWGHATPACSGNCRVALGLLLVFSTRC